MNMIYRVTVNGRKFESRDLRKLLARAVAEKRSMNRRRMLFGALQPGTISGVPAIAGTLCTENTSVL